MRLILLLAVFCVFTGAAKAQDVSVRGVVMEEQKDGKLIPLEFVSVYWLKSNNHTSTDSTGYFFIAKGAQDGDTLVFRTMGYEPDSVRTISGQYMSVVFKENSTVLGEVVVAHRKRTTEVSFLDPRQLQTISKEELFKAACCNLSESFTTNATVDVNFTDAITGAKEIQMLGLSGKYSLISMEQMPTIRGLAIPYGMLYIPGPWIESIQITKGVGSVLQGYESMTGQINVEMKKPHGDEKLHLNGFLSEALRSEVNVVGTQEVGTKFHTAVLGHLSLYPKTHDRNGDSFRDMTEGSLLTLTNRWDYHNDKNGIESQLYVNYTRDRKTGGNIQHGGGAFTPYNVGIEGDRIQALLKVGYVFPQQRYTSIGSQWGFTRHTQLATIGNHVYDAAQSSFFGNVLFQSIIGDTRHQYVAGASLRYDDTDEILDARSYAFREIVPGAFLEYTYKPDDKFSAVAGMRVDHHNLYGMLYTPRLHLRYAPVETTVFRATAGRGFRTPMPIAEHLGWLASSRAWTIGDTNDTSDLPYNGLKMEKSWNFGVSLTQEFTIDYRQGVLALDFYHTRFTDRIVKDLDISPQALNIYNLEGESFANVLQAEASYELIKRVDLKVAYKLQDARVTYRNEGLRRQIFTPLSRFFANLSYVTSQSSYKGFWRFSVTAHLTGPQRIPDTDSNPEGFQLPANSPSFWLMNAQITKVFKGGFEIYVGVENLGNFKQSPVILDAHNPSSQYFDSGLIWGPIFGREAYMGVRYSIAAKK